MSRGEGRYIPPEAQGQPEPSANEPHLVSHPELQKALREQKDFEHRGRGFTPNFGENDPSLDVRVPEVDEVGQMKEIFHAREHIAGRDLGDEDVAETAHAPGEGPQGGILVVEEPGAPGFEEKADDWRAGVVDDGLDQTIDLLGGVPDYDVGDTRAMTPEEMKAANEREWTNREDQSDPVLDTQERQALRTALEKRTKSSIERSLERRATTLKRKMARINRSQLEREHADGREHYQFGDLDVFVEKRIGAGGMGSAYLVREQGSSPEGVRDAERRYVMKLMDVHGDEDRFVERLVNEINETEESRMLVDVAMIETGGNPQFALLLELDIGDDFESVIQDEKRGEQLSGTHRGRYQLGIAMRAMLKDNVRQHKRGWEHRDIKPANTRFHEQVPHFSRAIDYGLARHKSEPSDPGHVEFTPGYLLPSAMTGIDPATGARDLYAEGLQFGQALRTIEYRRGENIYQEFARMQTGEHLAYANPSHYKLVKEGKKKPRFDSQEEQTKYLRRLRYTAAELELVRLVEMITMPGADINERPIAWATWNEPDEIRQKLEGIEGKEMRAMAAWELWEQGHGLTVERVIGELDGIIDRMAADLDAAGDLPELSAEMERYAKKADVERQKAWFEFDAADERAWDAATREQITAALLNADRSSARAEFGEAQHYIRIANRLMRGESTADEVEIARVIPIRELIERGKDEEKEAA